MRPPDGGRAEAVDLHSVVRRQLDARGHRDDPDVARLVAAIRRRHGDRVAAVLLYGSYLRGKRDTLLDFYVLLTDLGSLPLLQRWGNRALAPNVYYLSLPASAAGGALRAKYATLTITQFQWAMGDFHSYFWARFSQPTGLVACVDAAIAQRVTAALVQAVLRFAREVAPVSGARGATFTAAEFWHRGLALSYACELRSEAAAGVAELYRQDAGHFDTLLAGCAARPETGITPVPGGDGYRASSAQSAAAARRRWGLRRLQGKLLSVLRLIKAAGTFDDPLDYLLWKIERHSGIRANATERQRRHPLVFAWPLLWRLYRRGAFR